MCPEAPNENVENRPVDEAASDQLNQLNPLNEIGENEPMNSAETAQSITDLDSQTTQQKDDQDQQQNNDFVAVVDPQNEKGEILYSLKEFGISALRASSLIQQYGDKRLADVIKHTKTQRCTNPAGYLIRVLKENWTIGSKPEKDDYACGNGMAYITGKYADFIHH